MKTCVRQRAHNKAQRRVPGGPPTTATACICISLHPLDDDKSLSGVWKSEERLCLPLSMSVCPFKEFPGIKEIERVPPPPIISAYFDLFYSISGVCFFLRMYDSNPNVANEPF